MKKFKKTISLALSVLMLIAIFSSCADSTTDNDNGNGGGDVTATALGNGKDIFNDEVKVVHIALSTAGITNVLIQKGMKEQLLLYPNVTLEFWDAMYDVNKQISLVGEAVTQGYDLIIMEPLDTEALNNAILDAEAAGVPVITVNTGASAVHTLHMQGSDYAAGWISGEQLSKMTGGEGTAIVLDCPAEQKAVGLMGTGFEEYIAQNTNIELLESRGVPNWSTEEANTIMRDMLTKFDDITMVYCASDDIAMGAVQAIESMGRDGDGILVWGNCGYQTGLDAIRDGRMTGTCFSDVYVQYATALYFGLFFITTGHTSVTAGYTETPVVDQVMTPVTKDNVETVMPVSRWY